ncbi:MAG: hypothetical protein GTO02_20750, partial [Candidatus Dadabacteria bacterium]|nr:hypothetical protein [Candidatus Dadabacteria bacterium]
NLADEYIDNIRAANEIAAAVSKEDRSKFDELIKLKTSKHILVLDQLHENVPDQAKSAIEKARNAWIKGQETPKKSKSQDLKEKDIHENNDEFAERFNKVKELGKKEIDNIEEKSDNVLDPLSGKFAEKILEKMEKGKATKKGKS